VAWIESHQTLRDHPKTRKLARVLGISKPATIGHLQCLWWWATDYAEDGSLDRFDALDIAIGAEWDDDPETFVGALTDVGFLEQTDGGLVIHDWNDYAGKLIERRRANAERMRRARAEHDEPDDTERATHVPRTQRARAERQNSTVPNQTKPDRTESENGAGAPARPPVPVPKSEATRLTDDFAVTDQMRDWATNAGASQKLIDYETEQFRDYWCAVPGARGVKLDWPATWRKWLRKAIDEAPSSALRSHKGGRDSPPVNGQDEDRDKGEAHYFGDYASTARKRVAGGERTAKGASG
jgi:hypothetical protein